MTRISSDVGGNRVGNRVRWTLSSSAALVVAFMVFLIVRPAGSDYPLVDEWGAALFETFMSGLCIARYFDRSWRSNESVAKVFPLVLGFACLAWALGDVALNLESIGGATPPVPSVADGFYICFFPLCFIAFMMVIRRGNSGSLVATSLDGIIAGLGMASVSAAYVFNAVVKADGGGPLSAATNLAYPLGDLLLLAIAVGGLTILPKEYRRFLVIASCAMAANAAGDMFNLLQPDSKIGYVVDALAWPISLLLLAIATWVQPASAWVPRVTPDTIKTDRTAGFALPAVGAIASMIVLFTATFGHVGKAAVGLATATLLVAGIRLALTVRVAQALNSARFRSLIDKAWDVIVVAEANLDVAYITPSSQRVLGYPPQALQGRPVTDLVHPDDFEALVDHLRQLAAGTAETAAFETRMRHHNGVWRTIAWTATDLLADPSVRGYVLNGGDVTEARQAAEDLAAARDGALMASKAKSEFLSTMSHEIRTPMNGVIGLTELLLETSLDSDQQELASGVKVSAENLLVIINDILDFSKIEAGELDLEESPLNVAAVADDVGRIIAGAAHSKGLELLVDVAPDVPTALLGDMVRIQQVLLNLAANAVKFTFAGEVIIRVSTLDADADADADAEHVALRFDVIDMGIGIARSDQERLFRAFAQADSSTTRKYGGTGLGLAICRQLIELMGGTLGLISAPGEGSTFWFELSLRRSASSQHAETGGDPRTLTGLSALVVDDNATNRKILRQQLQSWGVSVAEAVDGYEALGLATAAAESGQLFDLAVIDLNMPGMDGIEIASTVKADPTTATMSLFLLSSSGERLSAAETHRHGFAASMTKPVRSSELFDCLITNLNDATPPGAPTKPVTPQPENLDVMGMILLVEDNTMNQLVGSKALAKLGYDFDIASNGREALTAIQARSYDAVLMDCQMPEMDGYEATAEVRRIEGGARRTPIIAMTAAAMDGDRETCLAAGMDDYITKPVRLDTIAAALERWIPRPTSDATATATGESISPSENIPLEPLDYSQIDLLRSLDDGDGAVFGEIIDQYLTQTTAGRLELARVVGAGDAHGLQRAAHTLKGASANVGATALVAVCDELEMQGRGARIDGAAGLVERFDTEFTRVRQALTQLLIRS